MKEIHNITEYQQKLLEGYQLTAEERDYLTALSVIDRGSGLERRFSFQEWRAGLHIETYSWVGVIDMEHVRIIIWPKFNRGFEALVDMICFVQRIPFYQPRKTSSDIGTSDLMELIINLFLIELEQLFHRGIVKEYVNEEDNLRQLRGRPDFLANLRENYNLPDSIYCRYDELVTDVAENQVILAALDIAHLFKLLPVTAKKLHRFRTEFSLLCQPFRGDVWPDFQYHRLNAHYRTAHKLAHYIISRVSVRNVYQFSHEAFCSLLVDMNKLFEDFIRELLMVYLPSNYKVRGQSPIMESITLNGASYRYIIPDLLVSDEESNKTTVIDTKYKNYEGKKLDTSDIFQLSYYAQYFHNTADAPHLSTIIYPRYSGEESKADFSLQLLPGTAHEGRLQVRSVSIEEILEAVKQGKNEELQQIAKDVVRIKEVL